LQSLVVNKQDKESLKTAIIFFYKFKFCKMMLIFFASFLFKVN
jgi:hypothetical protein